MLHAQKKEGEKKFGKATLRRALQRFCIKQKQARHGAGLWQERAEKEEKQQEDQQKKIVFISAKDLT